MISTGISRSHWPEDDVALVSFVDVALLVVVAATVLARKLWMTVTVIISLWTRRGSERSIMTARTKSSNEAVLECGISPGTGEQSFLTQIRRGAENKVLSDGELYP
jgi:hypothetical protein